MALEVALFSVSLICWSDLWQATRLPLYSLDNIFNVENKMMISNDGFTKKSIIVSVVAEVDVWPFTPAEFLLLLDQEGAPQHEAPLVQRARRLDSVFVFSRKHVSLSHMYTRARAQHSSENLCVCIIFNISLCGLVHFHFHWTAVSTGVNVQRWMEGVTSDHKWSLVTSSELFTWTGPLVQGNIGLLTPLFFFPPLGSWLLYLIISVPFSHFSSG